MATRAELETRRDTHAERLRSPELQGDEHKRVRKRIMAKLGKINKALGELDEAFSAAAAASSAAGTKRGAAGSSASSAASAASDSVSAAAADGDSSVAGGGKRAKLGNKEDKLKRKKKILFINKRLKLLAQRKQLKDARDVFAKAERKGLVDKHSFANIINANVRCGNMGGVDGAAALVSRMPAAGLAADVVVYTTLIKGYCNAGDIRSAVGALLSMVRTKHAATGAQRGQTLLPTVSGNWMRVCMLLYAHTTHAHARTRTLQTVVVSSLTSPLCGPRRVRWSKGYWQPMVIGPRALLCVLVLLVLLQCLNPARVCSLASLSRSSSPLSFPLSLAHPLHPFAGLRPPYSLRSSRHARPTPSFADACAWGRSTRRSAWSALCRRSGAHPPTRPPTRSSSSCSAR